MHVTWLANYIKTNGQYLDHCMFRRDKEFTPISYQICQTFTMSQKVGGNGLQGVNKYLALMLPYQLS